MSKDHESLIEYFLKENKGSRKKLFLQVNFKINRGLNAYAR